MVCNELWTLELGLNWIQLGIRDKWTANVNVRKSEENYNFQWNSQIQYSWSSNLPGFAGAEKPGQGMLKGEIKLLFEYVKSSTKILKMLINETCCSNKSFGRRKLVGIDKSCKSSQPWNLEERRWLKLIRTLLDVWKIMFFALSTIHAVSLNWCVRSELFKMLWLFKTLFKLSSPTSMKIMG